MTQIGQHDAKPLPSYIGLDTNLAMPLKVAVVGAGIAGLSAAVAIREAGHKVIVYEQSTFKNETGAAITITPNGCRILDSWGFDHDAAHVTEAKQVKQVFADTLEVFQLEDLTDVPSEFGGGFNFYHRADLHSELLRLAKRRCVDEIGSIEIKLGYRVVKLDVETGKAEFEDGKLEKYDLVVVADGVKSTLASDVCTSAGTLIRAPRSVFRMLIQFREIMSDPELSKMWQNQSAGYLTFFLGPKFGRGLHLVTYPCRSSTQLNLALLHDTHAEDEAKDDWNDAADRERMLEEAKNCHELVQKLLEKAETVHVHKLLLKEPLGNLNKDRAVVIGDAAHPMFPTHAQGAVLAIEEAAALGYLLTGVEATKVQERLKLYGDLLLERAHVVQMMSNFGSYQEAYAESKSRKLFPEGSPMYGDAVRKYFYGWDVLQEVGKLLVEQTGVSEGP